MWEKGRGGNEEEGRRREAVKTRKREKDGQEREDVKEGQEEGAGRYEKGIRCT